jgi:hypothetical protein
LGLTRCCNLPLLLLLSIRSIDCTSYFELESAEYQKRGIQLSPELWLVKMMVRGRAVSACW